MQEVSKCALCNREPNVDSYGVSSDPNFVCTCCGVVGLNAEAWNRVQAALRAEKELTELKNICRDSVNLLHSPFDGRMDRLEEKAEMLQHLHRLVLCGSGE